MGPVDTETMNRFYSSNMDFWRLIAGKYLHIGVFQTEDEDVDTAKQRTVDELAACSALNSKSLVLDLGSGTGASAVHLCKIHNCSVIGIDPAVEQIEFSIDNIPPAQKQKLKFQV